MKKTLIGVILLLSMTIYGFAEANAVADMKSQEVIRKPIEVKLTFVGDIMMHGPQIIAGRQGDGYDFSPMFTYVKPIFQASDIVIGNLETTLSHTGPFSGYPQFSAPAVLSENLKEAGFDILLHANNHILDRYDEGAIRTRAIVKKTGLASLGAVYKGPLYYPYEQYMIGISNFTYGTNGIRPRQVYVSYIDKEQIRKELMEMKDRGVDLKIVTFHFGNEYQRTPSPDQRALVSYAFEQGADVVMGGHPHVLQPDQQYGNKYVHYSLGNFVSNQRTGHRDYGIILSLTYELGGEQPLLKQVERQGTWVDKEVNGRNVYQIIPLQESAYELPGITDQDRLRMKQVEGYFKEMYGE